MFICQVPTAPRRKAPGQKYYSFRLAHTVRTGKQVRQVHLLNLGAKFPVPEDDWPALLALVDDIRADQPPLLPPDPQLVPWAERIVAHLKDIGFDPDAAPDRDLATVHLDSIRNSHARSAGGERLASWIRVTTTMKTKAGELITIRQDTRADGGEAELVRAVGMVPGLHRQRRRTRPPKIPAS